MAVVREFNRFDPTGFAFRYWTDTVGQPSLADLVQVDLVALRRSITALHECIKGGDTWIYEARRAEEEMLAEECRNANPGDFGWSPEGH